VSLLYFLEGTSTDMLDSLREAVESAAFRRYGSQSSRPRYAWVRMLTGRPTSTS
jgi:hypothetical protein